MEGKPVLATISLSYSSSGVFEKGNLDTKSIKVEKSAIVPKQLFIVHPTEEGYYPVFLFFHGCCMGNACYSKLFIHIASHGFIAIAPGDPRVCSIFCCCGNQELYSSAAVIDWVEDGLAAVLPQLVKPDTTKLAVGGHSRGGKIAFALALGQMEVNLKISAVFGVDPVAGTSPNIRPYPKIFSYIPRSFNQNIPVAVIGTGLGSEWKGVIPPFAPDGVNHAEFFNESKPPVYYYLAKDYGHADMLDGDSIDDWLARIACKSGKGNKEMMIRGCGGIIVAFLNAKLKGSDEDLNVIGENPGIAPIKLDPVIYVEV